MPNYFYTAKSFDNKTIKGYMLAQDARDLSRILKNEGLFLVGIDSKIENKKEWFDFSFFSRVSSEEKIIFTRNLSVMIATGLSLMKGFEVLTNQAKNKKMKSALTSIKERINKGETISLALSEHPTIFSEFFLSMVRIGEESGTLEESLKILSLQLEKDHKIKSGIKGAMIYPIIVSCLLIVVGIVVSIFVLPKFKVFFTGLGYEVPFITKLLFDFSDFSRNQWPILVVLPFVLFFLVIAAAKTKQGKWLEDTVLLKLPIFSSLVKKSNCAILIRSLSSLLGSGVPLTRSLEVTSGTVGNFYFKKALDDALDRVKKGQSLSGSLSSYKNVFPYGAVEMMQVGEETGKTSMVLKTLADFYEDEVMAATAKLSSVIEPVLLIIIGLIVGLFAFSIIGPMYSSLNVIK